MTKQKQVKKTLTTAPFRGSFFTSGYPLTDTLPNASQYENPPTDTQLEKFVKNREKIVSPIVMNSLKKHPEDVLHGSRSLSMLLPEFREPGDWDLFSPREKVRAQTFERSLDTKMKADIAKTVPVTLVESIFTARQPGNAEHLYRVVVPNSGMDAEIDVISKPRKLQTVKKDGITHESLESQYKRLDIRKDQITHMEKATRDKHYIEDYWKSKGLTVLPIQEEKPWMKPFSKKEQKFVSQKGKMRVSSTPFTSVNWVKESPLPLRDTDRDRIPDIFDCAPLDPFKQGILHNIAEGIKGIRQDFKEAKQEKTSEKRIPTGTKDYTDTSHVFTLDPETGQFVAPPEYEVKQSLTTSAIKKQFEQDLASGKISRNKYEDLMDKLEKAGGSSYTRVNIDQPILNETRLQKASKKYGFDKVGKSAKGREELRKRNVREQTERDRIEKIYRHYFVRDKSGQWQYFTSIPLFTKDEDGVLQNDDKRDEIRKLEIDFTRRNMEYKSYKGNPKKILETLRAEDSLGKTYKKNLAAKFKTGAKETISYDKKTKKFSGKLVDTIASEEEGKEGVWFQAKQAMGVQGNVESPDRRWGYKKDNKPFDSTSGMPQMALPAWGSTNPSRSYSKPQLKRAGVKAILSPDEYKSLLQQGWTEEDLDFRGIVSKRSPQYQEQSPFGKGVVPYRPIGMYQVMLPKPKRKTALFYPAPLTYDDVFFNPMKPFRKPEEQPVEEMNIQMPEEEQPQEQEDEEQ